MSRFAQFSAGDAAQADDFLSSHPSTPDRIQKAIETARAFFGAPGLGETDRDGYLAGDRRPAVRRQPGAGRDRRPALHPSDARSSPSRCREGYTLQNSKGAVVGVAGDGEAVRFDSAEVPAIDGARPTTSSRAGSPGSRPTRCSSASYNGIEMAIGRRRRPTSGTSASRSCASRARSIASSSRRKDRQRPQFARGAERDAPELPRRERQRPRADPHASSLKRDHRQAGRHRRLASRARWQNLTRGTELFYILNNLFPGDPVVAGREVQDRRRALARPDRQTKGPVSRPALRIHPNAARLRPRLPRRPASRSWPTGAGSWRGSSR